MFRICLKSETLYGVKYSLRTKTYNLSMDKQTTTAPKTFDDKQGSNMKRDKVP